MRFFRSIALKLFVLAFSLQGLAARISFDEDWKFAKQDDKAAVQPGYDDNGWRVLDVPHDWSIEGEYQKDNPMRDTGGYLPAGIAWYRKTIPVPQEWKGNYVEIAFDGVFMNSTVWANGKELGTRPYGWVSFSYDISQQVNTSDSITFVVRVDNEKQPAARWFTGSGIYGHVWIDVKDPVHVPTSGVRIRTKGEDVMIDTTVANTTDDARKVVVRTRIWDGERKKVLSTLTETIDVEGGKEKATSQRSPITNARKWSPEDPYLYYAVSEVMQGDQVLDRVITRFGVRDIEWRPETGMWMNGKNIKLRGVANHQDAGALGAAVPDKVLRFRIQHLKDMGCNTIRTAHNPQTPIFYEICDELGMMVMDEIFDGWSKKATNDYGAHFFDKWWRQDLTDWIMRDRNHPSIIIYSVGNETHGKVAKEIVDLCHKLDDTRPVTSGASGSHAMDVLGVNGASEVVGFFDKLKKDRVFIGTENTHTWQVRGYYRTKTWYRDGFSKRVHEIPDLTETEVFTDDWTQPSEKKNARKQIFNSSYDNATVRLNARQNIAQLRDIPNYAGSFRWTGHDYIGEAGYVHGGWPFKSFMGGAIDMANFEKDLYYLYQSQWTSKPMLHILPHWTHPVIKPGTEIPVWVYSNCDEVELFFNGKSLGKEKPGKEWDKMQCQWMVPWQAGELKAVGYKDGKATVQEVVRSASAPARIALSVDGAPLAAEGKDLVQVRVTTEDADGNFYPYGENRSYFEVMGPARIRALDNGSPIDVEKHFGTKDRIAFYGLTRAYIEATGEPGDIGLLVGCILGEKKQITSDKVSIDAEVLSLRGSVPQPELEIYYTVDGSKPNRTSTRYTGSFSVALGTTVKALVFADGKPMLEMQERFAKDEGFIWDAAPSAAAAGGDQAEDAKFSGAKVVSKGKGFHGKGYLDFGHNQGGFVEWYQENDGDEGTAELTIRYSGKSNPGPGRTMVLNVNGKVVNKNLLLPNTKDWGTDWKTVTTSIPIKRGANTIRLTTVGKGGMYLDDISVK